MKKVKILSILLCLILLVSVFAGCGESVNNTLDGTTQSENDTMVIQPIQNEEIKFLASEFSGEPFVAVNNNIPYFTDSEKKNTEVFEKYSELDNLGRCGVAYANVCKKLMPTEDRESLSSVTPSGWKNKQYDFVDGGWLYNRAHIIGFQLAGEQANKLNLITGTRYFNVDGMLTFENMVADYVKETNNHVLYRVTPIYVGNNLVAEGVLMEGWSVEDSGEGVCFNVFCYNVQPGVEINYATGDSWLNSEKMPEDNKQDIEKEKYILNTNSKKFHKEDCNNAKDISEKNKKIYSGTKDKLISDGYSPCGSCKP